MAGEWHKQSLVQCMTIKVELGSLPVRFLVGPRVCVAVNFIYG